MLILSHHKSYKSLLLLISMELIKEENEEMRNHEKESANKIYLVVYSIKVLFLISI